ncbi:restriction endonuclease subunit S [Candidatus Magnetominusculus xianensis]|uniref:restriction endonuclease subunit S n=1 Tax=Candidatus Magnetominusculus xianensis TaxID=1748249 RepID=UPI001F26FC29|nr:restriction endonuclease subunit S [Candidatus Magnetominusculus xianensis]
MDSIRFISRTEQNNGISAYVKKTDEIKPNPAHTISVAVSGSVLASFYQDEEYYSGRDLYYLSPKKKMSKEEMLFYAYCIKLNKYRYNYGRAANKTLKDILVPAEMPIQFKNILLNTILIPSDEKLFKKHIELQTEKWQWFQLQQLFDVKKGKRLIKADMTQGTTPFVGSIDSNNGYREYIGQEPIHKGNTITVNYNGSVAEAFYQPEPFWASDDVNVLYPKFAMNPFAALFLVTLIKLEKYRFNYGRKWHIGRMEISEIKLPVTIEGNPDFDFMENYIKSLPYSSSL